MNKQKRGWQETDYVLSVFGNSPATARRSYNAYVKAGSGQGRRPELTGGGLIRSLGVTQPAVSYAVSRGERIAREKNYSLVL